MRALQGAFQAAAVALVASLGERLRVALPPARGVRDTSVDVNDAVADFPQELVTPARPRQATNFGSKLPQPRKTKSFLHSVELVPWPHDA